jgi:hypothetical protein
MPSNSLKVSLLRTGFLIGLFFDTVYGGDISSETSVEFQLSTRSYIPEHITLLLADDVYFRLTVRQSQHRCGGQLNFNPFTLS